MKHLKFILVGVLFGIVMTKSEAVSWFRIQEMFRFHSIHMYGIIGTAVILGVVMNLLLKKTKLKNWIGGDIKFAEKPETYKASLLGGTVFGLGWAMTGACPGPLYTLVGHGVGVIIPVIISALLGTYFYGRIKAYLPH